jgi:hypothetical protein
MVYFSVTGDRLSERPKTDQTAYMTSVDVAKPARKS